MALFSSHTLINWCSYNSFLPLFSACACRNMSGHALMGCPAARLVTMVLVFSSYVLKCVICKRRWLSLYRCYFLIYVMILPCSLQKLLTRNHRYSTYDSTHDCIIVGILPKYIISYNKYHSTYHDCIFRWHHYSSRIVLLTPLFQWDLPISIVSTIQTFIFW